MVKADGYGHGAVACARRGAAGGATWLAVAAAAEAAELAAQLPEAPAPGDGRADRAPSSTWRSRPAPTSRSGAEGFREPGRRARARARRPARASTSSTTAAWAGSASATPRRSLALADAAAADEPDLELAGVWTHFATADEPDAELPRRAARALPPSSPTAVARAHPGCIAARRQQRRDAARARAPTSTWSAAGSRSTASTRSRRDPADARARAGARAALLRRRRQALRARGAAPATGAPGGAGATPGSACCRSATATASGAGSPTTREVLVGGRRYPLVGTVSMDNVTVDLGPETDGRAGRRGGPDRRPGRRADPRRGAGRAPRDDQLRGHLRDLAAGAARARRRAR